MASAILSHPISSSHQSLDVRRELERRLPGVLQPLISVVTGRPREGEKPLVELSTPVLVGLELVALIASLVVGIMPFNGSPWALLLLPYAFCTAVGRLRWFQTDLAHFAIHGEISGRTLCARLGTVLPLAQNEDDYEADHVGEHHPLKSFGTAADPDAAVLLRFGFTKGMPEAKLLRHLLLTLFSPTFHIWFIKTRVVSNLRAPRRVRRFMAAVWLLVLFSLLAVMPVLAWVVMVVGVYTVGYQSAALLQFTSEHYWLAENPPGTRRAVELSHGRFAGEQPPAGGGLSWVPWVAKMLTIHLLTRLAVLPGSLPSHDAHHVAQRRVNPSWKTANFVRSALIAEGKDLGMADREVWGLGASIRAVFATMARD